MPPVSPLLASVSPSVKWDGAPCPGWWSRKVGTNTWDKVCAEFLCGQGSRVPGVARGPEAAQTDTPSTAKAGSPQTLWRLGVFPLLPVVMIHASVRFLTQRLPRPPFYSAELSRARQASPRARNGCRVENLPCGPGFAPLAGPFRPGLCLCTEMDAVAVWAGRDSTAPRVTL